MKLGPVKKLKHLWHPIAGLTEHYSLYGRANSSKRHTHFHYFITEWPLTSWQRPSRKYFRAKYRGYLIAVNSFRKNISIASTRDKINHRTSFEQNITRILSVFLHVITSLNIIHLTGGWLSKSDFILWRINCDYDRKHHLKFFFLKSFPESIFHFWHRGAWFLPIRIPSN